MLKINECGKVIFIRLSAHFIRETPRRIAKEFYTDGFTVKDNLLLGCVRSVILHMKVKSNFMFSQK
jgi:hypothetical protein